MLCIKCGNENDESNTFCGKCGNKLVSYYNEPAVQKKSEDMDEFLAGFFEEDGASRNEPTKPAKEEIKPVIETRLTQNVPFDERQFENALSKLSTAGINKNIASKVASNEISPMKDPYWDDVLPEIEKEISSIPKDTIIKLGGILVGCLFFVAYLLFNFC